MDDSKSGPSDGIRWIDRIIAPAKWEAPDRKFVGHRDVLTRSLARYYFVSTKINNKLLEIGCGRGYGLESIMSKVSMSFGVDISNLFLRDAIERKSGIIYLQASGDTLPFKDNTFDSLIAFEVIEHIHNDLSFLHGIKRIVKNGGFIAISTPNRLIASGNSPKPLDRFHVREYTYHEFYELLRKVFSIVEIFGQYEEADNKSVLNNIIDKTSIRYKYILPAFLQGYLSTKIRPPLVIPDCKFSKDNLDRSHTFVALCYA